MFMQSRRIAMLSTISLPILLLNTTNSKAKTAKGEWTVPDGTEEVRVAMYDKNGELVLSRKLDVEPGYRFTVEATK